MDVKVKTMEELIEKKVRGWVPRFWSKVDKSGDCWLWTAGKDRSGFGVFHRSLGSPMAHRIAYELTYGEIPDANLTVAHRCGNPACVHPEHLFLADGYKRTES